MFGEGHVRISAKTYSGVEELTERILEEHYVPFALQRLRRAAAER